VYSGLSSYRHLQSTERMYPVWPASVGPEKEAWEAAFEPMEMAPKAVERTDMTSDGLFGVCVCVDTRLN
jgi:hypothetical protein